MFERPEWQAREPPTAGRTAAASASPGSGGLTWCGGGGGRNGFTPGPALFSAESPLVFDTNILGGARPARPAPPSTVRRA